MPDRSHTTRLVASLLISLFFLYLTFMNPQIGSLFRGEQDFFSAFFGHSRFDLSGLGQAIVSAQWGYIAIAGVLFVVSLLLRAVRWRLMLLPMTRISYSEVFGAMNIGYMANNVLPFRMGEVYRAQVIFQLTGLSRTAAFGSIVLERVMDLLFLIPFIGAAVLLYPLPPNLQKAAYISAGAAFAITIFFVWLVFARHHAIRVTRALVKILPHKLGNAIISLMDTFTSGLGALGRVDLYVWLSLISVVLWAIYAMVVYLMLASLGLTQGEFPLVSLNPVGAALVLLVITTVGFIIPGAPGAVGTYHGVAVLGLSLFDIPGDRAAGFAILLHALNYIPLTLLGLAYFWKFGLSFKSTRALGEEFAESGASSTDSDAKQVESRRLPQE